MLAGGVLSTYAYYIDEFQFLMRATLDNANGGVELGRLPFSSCPQANMVVVGGVLYWTDVCSQGVHRSVLP